MKPRGPLMIEHRLIEKMLKIAEREVQAIKEKKEVDPLFIDTVVDFIRTYADRTHHGKEEDILFRDLAKKKLKATDQRMMQDLVDEHVQARKVVGELVEAKNGYVRGDTGRLPVIADKLTFLVNFYPEHIRKEDKEFFPNTEACFTKEELDAMLEDFREFDSTMIHEKYKKVFDGLSRRNG